MILQEKITENTLEFLEVLRKGSDNLSIKPEWVMLVMGFETAWTFDPKIVNFQKGDSISAIDRVNKGRAFGLIQFMPSTVKMLGTTPIELYNKSNVEQLKYVFKYLSTIAKIYGNFKSFTDVYLAVFYPAAISKSEDYILPGSKIAKQNPIFDANKDGQITKAEIKQRLLANIPELYKKYTE